MAGGAACPSICASIAIRPATEIVPCATASERSQAKAIPYQHADLIVIPPALPAGAAAFARSARAAARSKSAGKVEVLGGPMQSLLNCE
jgi:hypothetical protein